VGVILLQSAREKTFIPIRYGTRAELRWVWRILSDAVAEAQSKRVASWPGNP